MSRVALSIPPLLSRHVHRVFLGCPKPEMVGVYTWRVVARMADNHSIWDFAFVCQRICDAARARLPPVYCELSIAAILRSPRCPLPALVGSALHVLGAERRMLFLGQLELHCFASVFSGFQTPVGNGELSTGAFLAPLRGLCGVSVVIPRRQLRGIHPSGLRRQRLLARPVPPVYPRPRGGTVTKAWGALNLAGLSPPTRGNHRFPPDDWQVKRSIPAHAGEPRPLDAFYHAREVYPRPRGGT